jgi:molecular chaperone HtpG
VHNTEDQHFTLDEYKEKTSVNQKDKNEQVIWLYASDTGKQDAYISSAKKYSYDVLVLDGMLDSHWANHLEQKLEKVSLKRVDADVADKLVEKEEKRESVLGEEEQNKLKDIFTKAVDNTHANVNLEALATDEMPVLITKNEFMRRMADMAKTGGGQYAMFGAMPENFQVTINTNHPAMNQILAQSDEEAQKQMALQAYDIALLGQDMLSGKRLTAFLERSVGMLSKG